MSLPSSQEGRDEKSVVRGLTLCLCHGLYRHRATVETSLLEGDDAVRKCIEGVVAAHADILAGIVLRATLANNNIASYAVLTTKNLHTESLSCGLAAVLRTTYTFFMCHVFSWGFSG